MSWSLTSKVAGLIRLSRGKLVLVTVALLATSPQPAFAVVSDGHEYTVTCTKSGYRLDSLYPVVRMVGEGAGTRAVKGNEILYLGRSCDAYTKVYGYGSWCWANGGFFAKFDRHHYAFPRQELVCTPDPTFQLNCGC